MSSEKPYHINVGYLPDSDQPYDGADRRHGREDQRDPRRGDYRDPPRDDYREPRRRDARGDRRDDYREPPRGDNRGDRRDDYREPPRGDNRGTRRDDYKEPPRRDARGDRRDDYREPPRGDNRGDRRDDYREPPRGNNRGDRRDDYREPPRGNNRGDRRDDYREPPRGDNRGDRRDDYREPPRGDKQGDRRDDYRDPAQANNRDVRRGDAREPPRGETARHLPPSQYGEHDPPPMYRNEPPNGHTNLPYVNVAVPATAAYVHQPPPLQAAKKDQGECNCCLSRRTLIIIAIVAAVLIIAGVAAAVALILQKDPCQSTAVRCNGVSDCANSTDEQGCARMSGTQAYLEVWNTEAGVFSMVCADNFTEQLAKQACSLAGYDSGAVSWSAVAVPTTGSTVIVNGGVGYNTNVQLVYTPGTCTNSVVSIICVACGTSSKQITTRIIGGAPASLGSWPWQVGLQYNGQYTCGGTLITTTWVLSAAHCFQGDMANSNSWQAFVGIIYQPGTNPLSISNIITHSLYVDNTNNDYDIALVKLSSPLAMSSTIVPACLPNYDMDFEIGMNCWITGWGATKMSGPATPTLQEVSVPILSTETCNAATSYDGKITSRMVCAGNMAGGQDACQGDSGGPLACPIGATWYVAGATSFGEGCALKNFPGVYSRVTAYLDWIHGTMQMGN